MQISLERELHMQDTLALLRTAFQTPVGKRHHRMIYHEGAWRQKVRNAKAAKTQMRNWTTLRSNQFLEPVVTRIWMRCTHTLRAEKGSMVEKYHANFDTEKILCCVMHIYQSESFKTVSRFAYILPQLWSRLIIALLLLTFTQMILSADRTESCKPWWSNPHNMKTLFEELAKSTYAAISYTQYLLCTLRPTLMRSPLILDAPPPMKIF